MCQASSSQLNEHPVFCFFPHKCAHTPPRPYLSLSAEFHTEPLCSISPSILVPSIPGNRSSVSTEYCLSLPSRLRSRTAGKGQEPHRKSFSMKSTRIWVTPDGYLTPTPSR